MNDLEKIYRDRYDPVLKSLAQEIENQLREHLKSEPRIDRISARAKSVDRFLAKAETIVDGAPKYSDPIQQIQDQIGVRIITLYISDIHRVSEAVKKYYHTVESIKIVPESEWKFGYFGTHLVLLMPTDLMLPSVDKKLIPDFFELQIKTLFQHAWSEANHDLGYKPDGVPPDAEATRRLAFTSAQAWGADQIFDELFRKHSNVAANSNSQ